MASSTGSSWKWRDPDWDQATVNGHRTFWSVEIQGSEPN